MDGAQLFLFFAWNTNHRQSLPVALDEAVQLQAQRFGIQSIGLYPFVAFVEFLRTDHMTFDPKGRPMEPDDIRVVAMHEVGHVLGLDHSKDSTDIMFPTAKVRELSDRDVRTVRLLYELTPGSVR